MAGNRFHRVNWRVSPMQELIFKERVRSDPRELVFWKKDLTERFLSELKQRDSVVLWIFGGTGSGKSSLALSLALDTDPCMSADRVAFDNSELEAVIKESGQGDSIIRDETVKDFGEGSDQLLSMVQDATETLRKRRNSFFLLSPVIKGVPFVHFYLEVLQSNVALERGMLSREIKKGLKHIWFRVGVWSDDQKPLGFITRSVEVNNKLFLDYELKKDDFVKAMAEGSRTSGLNIEAEAKRFLEEMDVAVYKLKSERLNYIKMNSNYTLGQVKSIHIELERLIRIMPRYHNNTTERKFHHI